MGVPVHKLMRRLEDEETELAARDEEHLELAVNYVQFLAEVVRGAPGTWAREAACKGYTHLYFVPKGQTSDPARALCEVCPVIEQCRAWGDEQGAQQFGFLAGESRTERTARRAAKRQ